jgi:Transglutaminase-like superfamily
MRNLLRPQAPTSAPRATPASSLTRRRLLSAGVAGLTGTLLSACGGGDEEASSASGSSARLSAVVIANHASEAIHFNLELNGRSFFCNDGDVLRAIGVQRTGTNDLDVAMAVWRFVLENRYHHEPYSPRAWAHAPALFFNSIGFGLCDDAASLFWALATHAGLESRVWFLNGHLVAEALIDGRWVVFDSDLEAYYLDRSGRPAGVAQLAADPTLVSSPQLTLPASTRLIKALEGLVPGLDGTRAPAYLPFIAEIYATTQDNWVEP